MRSVATAETRAARSDSWRDGLLRALYQHPLIETAPSVSACRQAISRPRAIFMGFGLCSPDRLTSGVPIDILGMLLPAEILRRAVGAPRMVALVADRHAAMSFPADAVEERAGWFERVLERARERLPLDRLEILRASSFHDEPKYRTHLELVGRRADGSESDYLARQVADVAYLQEEIGPLLKVGWCLSKSCDPTNLYDERGFDTRVERYTSHRIPYVYTKPGRVLHDRRRKAVPYVVRDSERRICLHRGEAPKEKLERAGRKVSRDTYRGVYKHLVSIAKAYAELEPEAASDPFARLETLIDQLAA